MLKISLICFSWPLGVMQEKILKHLVFLTAIKREKPPKTLALTTPEPLSLQR